MFVTVRSDSNQADNYILAGDLIYSYTNLTGSDPNDPMYVPIGLAGGSQTNLLLSSDTMLKLVGGEAKRVIPIHDENLGKVFPSRVTSKKLSICEIRLAKGEISRVQ
jgi:N-acyl homoserine lactone hydrolase